MSDLVGEIKIYAGLVVPKKWAACDGQLLSVIGNEEIFLAIGNKYGGDGLNNLNLPDLRGRSLLHKGQGTNLTERNLAEKGGLEAQLLALNEIPTHNHSVSVSVNQKCFTQAGGERSPSGNYPSLTANGDDFNDEDNALMAGSEVTASVANSGGGTAHNNMQPYLVVNFIIRIESD